VPLVKPSVTDWVRVFLRARCAMLNTALPPEVDETDAARLRSLVHLGHSLDLLRLRMPAKADSGTGLPLLLAELDEAARTGQCHDDAWATEAVRVISAKVSRKTSS
jgi:hypothetical protein